MAHIFMQKSIFEADAAGRLRSRRGTGGMMWSTSFLWHQDELQEIFILEHVEAITAPNAPPDALLVRLDATENEERGTAAFVALVVVRLWMHAGQWQMDMRDLITPPHPAAVLPTATRKALREQLAEHWWEAWCRTLPHIREALGADSRLRFLVDIAKETGIHITTLSVAARGGKRLPTIATGRQHVLYFSTFEEAQARGHFHGRAGRPKGS